MGFIKKTETKEIVRDIPHISDRQWSEQQLAILEWFEHGSGNLVGRARAGTGKTTVIVGGVKRAPEAFILVTSFGKKIVNELKQRVEGGDVQTLHALGNTYIRREWRGVQVKGNGDDRAYWLTDQVCEKSTPRQIRSLVTRLHTKGREMMPLTYSDTATMTDLAYRFDFVPDESWGGYNVNYIVGKAQQAMQLAATQPPDRVIGIDFADMIFLPLVHNLVAKDYELVVVDEAQDMTVSQLELAVRSCSGRICIVGDDRQCQPEGTRVLTPTGYVNIEFLGKGDSVETFDRYGQVFIKSGVITEIEARLYDENLIVVNADGKSTRCTPQHKWLVRWTNRSANAWITYLMQKGNRFRVGQCQLFRKGCSNFGLSERARVEQADAAWILKVHPTIEEALAYEQVISVRYGLPEMVFYPSWGIKHFTQPVIDYVYNELGDRRANAVRCLIDHDRDINFPIYQKARRGERRGRTTLFETQACNLIDGYMAVPVAPEIISGHDKKDRHAVVWSVLSTRREWYKGLVYSLNVATHHKYVADGLVTCNSIYGFRGADTQALDRLKSELQAVELPLTVTYRCPTKIVTMAQKLVNDFQGLSDREGVVEEAGYGDLFTSVKGGREPGPFMPQPGDFVLSRLNAPLVSITLRLLRLGVSAHMAGPDIGAGIEAIIKRFRLSATTPVGVLLEKLAIWEDLEIQKLAINGRQDLIYTIEDKANTIRAFAENQDTVGNVIQRCQSVLVNEDSINDFSRYVFCSSVHKAKGLEADTVFVLKDTFYRQGPLLEEDNVFYVALTRTRRRLILVHHGQK